MVARPDAVAMDLGYSLCPRCGVRPRPGGAVGSGPRSALPPASLPQRWRPTPSVPSDPDEERCLIINGPRHPGPVDRPLLDQSLAMVTALQRIGVQRRGFRLAMPDSARRVRVVLDRSEVRAHW